MRQMFTLCYTVNQIRKFFNLSLYIEQTTSVKVSGVDELPPVPTIVSDSSRDKGVSFLTFPVESERYMVFKPRESVCTDLKYIFEVYNASKPKNLDTFLRLAS